MDEKEYFRIKVWRSILVEVEKEYPGRTINNIIQNLDSRIDYAKKHYEKFK